MNSKMIHNYLLPSLFGIFACFWITTFAFEAIIDGVPINGDFEDWEQYQVSVQFQSHNHVCGGGIIGDRFVLTAAHCVLNHSRLLRSSRIYVLAGTTNLNKTGPPAVTIRVKKIFFPREFHPSIEFNYGDIAVLKLADSLQLRHREHLQALHLPLDDNLNRGFIMGFGWTEYHKEVNRTNEHLQILMVDILSHEDCEEAFPCGAIESDHHLCGKKHLANKRMQYGVCNGDTGGPLTDIDGTTVIGILGRIPTHCDEREHPAIYARVIYYVRRILNVMEYGRDPEMVLLHA